LTLAAAQMRYAQLVTGFLYALVKRRLEAAEQTI
jgi:hypothetical protein